MEFTITVQKKAADEDFRLEHLDLRHDECMGGRIEIRGLSDRWTLACLRCHLSTFIPISEEGSVALMKTAVDGSRRQLNNAPPHQFATFVVGRE
jgi:hypothetical protein